jgi:hypothetical protein
VLCLFKCCIGVFCFNNVCCVVLGVRENFFDLPIRSVDVQESEIGAL